LEALIPTDSPEAKGRIVEIDIGNIVPNKYQTRLNFDEKSLGELADSIRERSLIQPIIVSPSGRDKYELITGERRWRAAKIAGYKRIPAIIRDLKDRERFECSLIENIQREDLNPIEEAMAYERMMDEFNLTQEKLAQRLGKKRSSIANTLRLLNLPEEIIKAIIKNKMSSGHARAILSVRDGKGRNMLAQRIIKEHLSVRETEELAARLSSSKRRVKGKRRTKSAELQELEERLQRVFGTKVEIRVTGKKGGKIQGALEIHFYSQEDLERILEYIKER